MSWVTYFILDHRPTQAAALAKPTTITKAGRGYGNKVCHLPRQDDPFLPVVRLYAVVTVLLSGLYMPTF